MTAALPDVFLPYQQRLVAAVDEHAVVVCEKSRRIGATWAVGAQAVLTSAAAKADGGMDTLYIGYNLDMAREFIDTCAEWARGFHRAGSAVQEFVFVEQGEDGGSRDIQAFRIHFASGFDIVALTSRPRSLRGRQGFVIIDEAAFHDELAELLKAALALLMWGGRVLVISTHDGVDNPFNELLEDSRAGRRPYHIVRVTFDEALAEGLYQRICLVRGKTWSPEAEAVWREEIVAFYGDAADEELFCIPRDSGGAWLPRALIEARMVEAPVLRWRSPAGFATWSEAARHAPVQAWLEGEVAPVLAELELRWKSGYGMDFGRSGDLSVIAPWQTDQQLVRRFPFLVELGDMPFRQQEQVLFFIADRLPRFVSGAMDARGNGQYLAEVAAQRYGATRVEQVMLSEPWYREHTAPFKAAFEDATIAVPRDASVLDDLRAFEVVRGVPRLPTARTRGKGGEQRHGDSGIALLLGYYASCRDVAPIAFQSTGVRRAAATLEGEWGSALTADRRRGWGVVGGARSWRAW